MKPGTLIEYRTNGEDHRLGAVVDVVGRTKLVVLTASGDENRPERDDVTFTLAGNFDPGDREAAVKAVKGVERRVGIIESELDIAEIWAVAGTGQAYELPELARACGNGSGMAQIALGRLLRGDDVYFRQRKGLIEARSVGQVEEALREQEVMRARDSRRSAFVEALAAVLAGPTGSRAERFRALEVRDAEAAHWAELLRSFAADESSHPRREEAEALLDEVERAAGLRLTARAMPRGFELMRELELWRDHEVLSIHRFGLRREHDRALIEAAQAAAAGGFARDGREDFTGWWTLTIDDADSRDIDDALSIRPTLDGGWELAIHIADPDAFVQRDSALDRDARERGASMYLPDAVYPMFPEALSGAAMSLSAGEDRPALTTHVTLDSDLDVVTWRHVESVVHVNRRLSYEEADALLEGGGNDHATSVLRDLAFIADELHAQRLANGARSVELPEPRVRVTGGDVEVGIVRPSAAHALVAEMMVLVGSSTARFCVARDVPIIFRVQDVPHGERDEARIRRIPAGWAREVAVLMSMQRGRLSTHPDEHAGLGLEVYAQATSPIRRYADLVTQRQLKAVLRGDAAPYDATELQKIASTVERALDEVATAEREARTYWLIEHLRRREGEIVRAVVVGLDGRRADVVLIESGFRTQGRVREGVELGDEVELRIVRAQPRPPTLVLEQP